LHHLGSFLYRQKRYFLGPLILLLGLLLAWGGGRAALAAEPPRLPEAHFRYRLDRSRVPSWVVLRQVTLVVDIGPALDVVALGDGQPVPCHYDGQRALVTTDAEEVELIVSAPQRPLEEMGSAWLAPLQDNKLWALSLTLDDGYESQVTTAKEILDRYGYRATSYRLAYRAKD